MFSKKPTKSELRNQLSAEVSQFLKEGGAIKQVEMGASGLVDGKYNSLKGTFDKSSQTTRTPVHGLLATIDSRRGQKTKAVSKTTNKAPKKKVIYDDFGEPIRTVWIDE